MKKITAVTLRNHFTAYYRRRFDKEYDGGGQGLDLILFKRLLQSYDPYQLLEAMVGFIDGAVEVNVKNFYREVQTWMPEDDPLLAKARYAMVKDSKVKSLYYAFADELDAFFPNESRKQLARKKLEKAVRYLP